MNQKIEIPLELLDVISTSNSTQLGLFGQTSSYLRSLSWQNKFLYNQQTNNQTIISHILIELFINYPLLLKKSAQILHPSWCLYLQKFRKRDTTNITSNLLATALLLFMDTDNKSCLENEFEFLLNIQTLCNPQLANSILAILAKNGWKTQDLEKYFEKHSISDLLHDSHQVISVMEAKLLLIPFIEKYAENNYFPIVFGAIKESTNPNIHTFFNIIIAMLKIIPLEHTIWKTPFETIPNLLLSLPGINDRPSKFLVIILETIQNRLEDKQFLSKYLENFIKETEKDHPLTHAIQTVILNANIADKTEDWLVENKDLFIQGYAYSISSLSHHLAKLESEVHIKMFIEQSLLINFRYNDPIIYNIFTLLPKISSPDFLIKTIRALCLKLNNMQPDRLFQKLASFCTSPLLNEIHITKLIKTIYPLITTSTLNTTLIIFPVLCSRVESQTAIQELYNLFTYKRSVGNWAEWLNDHKAYVCLESLFIFISNLHGERALTDHLMELLTLRAHMFYMDVIPSIIVSCMTKISSCETTEDLIKLLLLRDEVTAYPHLGSLALITSKPNTLINYALKFRKLLNANDKIMCCQYLLKLYFSLPRDESMNLNDHLFNNACKISTNESFPNEENSSESISEFF